MSPEFTPLTLRLTAFFKVWAARLPVPSPAIPPTEFECSGIELAVWLAAVELSDLPVGFIHVTDMWNPHKSGAKVFTSFDENTDLTDEPVITAVKWHQRDPLLVRGGVLPTKDHAKLLRLPAVVAFLRMVGQS